MVAVHREAGFRIDIYTDDHAPAHVHVVGAGEAKINLSSASGRVELVWSVGMTQAEKRRALRMVAEQQAVLLRRWSMIHG